MMNAVNAAQNMKSRWKRIADLQRAAKVLIFIQQNGIETPEQLALFKQTASKKEAAICDRIEHRVRDMRDNMRTQKLEGGEKSHEWRRRR